MHIKHQLFSLFHHDVHYQNKGFAFNSQHLFSLIRNKKDYGIKEFADVFQSIVSENIKGLKKGEISLTLTGGMDSRLILACLLKAGIKPNCLTFGNPNTQDVVISKKITESLNLPFHNTCQQKPTKEWYYKWVIETIERDNGNSHLHRAHRTAAIAEHAEKYNPKVIFTGHMGGEGVKGFAYNNYYASPFFEWVNEAAEKPLHAAKKVLNDYFIKPINIDYNKLLAEVQNLSWMKHNKENNKFFFLYDLIAKIHHDQDLRLYQSYVPTVVPVFLQNEYLEMLFTSPYNLLSKKNNMMVRLKNPEFSCKIIQEIYPSLLDFPFASGFTPQDYLKGFYYYVPKKLYHDYTKKKKYPPTFSYGQWYVDFVKEHSKNINSNIWDIYDKKLYIKSLEDNKHKLNEGYWHKFSNPIYFDLVEKYQNGKL